MGKIKVGFDIGGSSMKAAVAQGNSFRVESVRLPEKLVDENGITMPNAFSQFLKQTVKELRLPHGSAALVLPANHVICRLVSMPEMTQDQLLMNLPYELVNTLILEGMDTPLSLPALTFLCAVLSGLVAVWVRPYKLTTSLGYFEQAKSTSGAGFNTFPPLDEGSSF